MTTSIAIVCGSFHKNEIEQMLAWAKDEASSHGLEIAEVVWVPGAMECHWRLIGCSASKIFQGLLASV